MVKKMWMAFFLMAVLVLIPGQDSQAASAIVKISNAIWTNAASWSWIGGTGVLPTSADTVYVRDGLDVTIDSDVGTITRFYIGDDSSAYTPGGLLKINSGRLVVSADSSCIARQASGAVGTLNLNGGTLQIGDTTGSLRIYVGLDSAGKPCQGFLNINGGAFIGRLLVGSTGVADAISNDTVTITGSNATIGCTSTSGIALEVRASGVLKFVFGPTGISTMDYGASGSGVQASFDAGSQIIIDGAAYTGGDATFNLIKAGTLGTTIPTIILTNCAAGTTYSYNTTTEIVSVNMKSPTTKSLKLMMVQ